MNLRFVGTDGTQACIRLPERSWVARSKNQAWVLLERSLEDKREQPAKQEGQLQQPRTKCWATQDRSLLLETACDWLSQIAAQLSGAAYHPVQCGTWQLRRNWIHGAIGMRAQPERV